MRLCIVDLTSVTPYSQSKMVDVDVHPKKEKEGHGDYDIRMWKEKSSFDASGQVVIPQMALKMAVDEAVKRLNISIPGRGKSTYSKFFVAGQICEADVPIGVTRDQLQYIDIWANADGIRGSGKRVKRRFPYVQEWRGQAKFAILDDVIPSAVFEKAMTEAGRLVGIGRFRPEKGGFLGRFTTTNFTWTEV